MNQSIRPLLGALCALAGAAVAAVPGLFVIQEARIDDPASSAVTKRTFFGASQMAVVGDIDGDGVQDLVAGAPSLDTGALQFVRLTRSGKIAGLSPLSARDPAIRPYLATSLNPEGFGSGAAVVTAFAKSQPCATVLTSSRTLNKLWAVKVCRDASNGLFVSSAQVYDTTTVALTGLGLKGSGLGSSMAVLDTLPSGERLIAVGAPAEGETSSSREGKVVLLTLHPGTLSLHRVRTIPESYAAETLGAFSISAGGQFGTSVAALRGVNGSKGLAVVSSGSSRIHLISLDASLAPMITVSRGVAPDANASSLYSVSTADFNHDGVSDLALGFPSATTGNLSRLGSVMIQTLGAGGSPWDSTVLHQAGFRDSASALSASCRFGAQVLATDFDGDGQVDLVVGSTGNAAGSTPNTVGALWALRMKSAPWRLRTVDTVFLVGASTVKIPLGQHVAGNGLKWSVPPRITLVDPVANCVLRADTLLCTAGTENGHTSFQVVASDTGNIPSDQHVTDTLSFVLHVSGLVGPVGVDASTPPALRLDARSRPGTLRIVGGAHAFQVELLDVEGARLEAVSGAAGQTLDLELGGRRGIVLARIREAGAVRVIPVFVGR